MHVDKSINLTIELDDGTTFGIMTQSLVTMGLMTFNIMSLGLMA